MTSSNSHDSLHNVSQLGFFFFKEGNRTRLTIRNASQRSALREGRYSHRCIWRPGILLNQVQAVGDTSIGFACH